MRIGLDRRPLIISPPRSKYRKRSRSIFACLELQPNDSNAREKLATGFMLTNQRGKAIEMLQEIIQQHPEKYQPYELLGRVLEEDAKALAQADKTEEAKAEYSKAAASFEQSLPHQSRAAGQLRPPG